MRSMNVTEAAEYAGREPSAVRDGMQTGDLMWKRVGRGCVTTRRWVEEWLNGQR